MFDLNSVVAGLIQSFEEVKSEDQEVRVGGFNLFGAETTTMKEAGKGVSELASVVGNDFEAFETRFNETSVLYVDYLADIRKKEEAAKMAVVFAETVKGQLEEDVAQAKGTDRKVILSGVGVEVFCTVTNYENNRDVEARAVKQAKIEGAHQTGDHVAIVMLDPERNKELWERTEREHPVNTLPFIKVDGHTRAYGWNTPNPKDPSKYLFARPESLFITVYKNQEDHEIYQLVQDYCSGVNKATNGELQQMGMKRVEFAPISDFVKKDSWKTAFRTIKLEYGKNVDLAIETFREELEAIDDANIGTKATHKKLSGVRAAMITTYEKAGKGKWRGFWSMFFNPKTRADLFLDLWSWLEENSTAPAKEVMQEVEDAFLRHTSKGTTLAEIA